MSSSRLPRFLLSLLSLALVLWLVKVDLAKTNPGEMSAVHASITTFLGQADCLACHGKERQSDSLSQACLACHEAIDTQRQQQSGLHGKLTADLADACDRCHQEHHGRDFALVTDLAFQLAGFRDRASFDHLSLGFTLDGKHAALACQECHEQADVKVLRKGENRFLGLDRACTTCHEDPHEGDMGQDCTSCHGQERPFGEVATFAHTSLFPLEGVHGDLACLRCHEEGSANAISEEQAQSQRQTLAAAGVRDCVSCHESPHRMDFTLAGQQCVDCHGLDQGAFASATIRMDEVEHEACGFSLAAPHAQLACVKCHAPESGNYEIRFPGRTQDLCASCHEDPHKDQFLETGADVTDCLTCHQRQAFQPSLFDRKRHRQAAFALDGAHLQADCTACHQKQRLANGSHAVLFRGLERECSSCHQNVHGQGFTAKVPRLGADPDCASCHDTNQFADIRPQSFDHGKATGVVLLGAHAEATCSSCHQPRPEADEHGRRFGLVAESFPNHAQCADCHQDVHEGKFARQGTLATLDGKVSCDRCHDQQSFSAIDSAAFEHERWTGFALDGIHGRTECSSCHLDARDDQGEGRRLGPASLLLKGGNPARCASCHQDPHDGVFDKPGAPSLLAGKSSCARCHDQESFANLHGDNFDHRQWTGFPLAGAHAQADCARCHGRVADSQFPQGRLGSASSHFPRLRGAATAARCDQCHQDPHGQTFRPPRVPASLSGKTSCDRCHSQGSFRITDGSFDHDRFTGFALQGSHQRLDCSQCHAAQPRSRQDGRSFAPARGTDCTACHQDPHAGQFRKTKRCTSCHGTTGTFVSGLQFNHQRDSRFALDETHRRLACTSCHRDYPLANGGTVRRYLPLGTTCKDCHGFQ